MALLIRIILLISLLLHPLTITAAGDLVINEIMASNISAHMNPDKSDFVDWIELYNRGDSAVNIQGIYITDDLSNPFKWHFQEYVEIQPGGYYVIWADEKDVENHTSFKLYCSGEQVGLFNPDGSIIDTLTFGLQKKDISFGRYPDGEDKWYYFASPTFHGPNSSTGVITDQQVPVPEFSPEGGLYSGLQNITLSSAPGATIRFTLDGSLPDKDSEKYDQSISFSGTTVIRARAFYEGLLPSDVVTQSYLIDEPATFPVISITTPPEYLFDEEIGITVGICVSDKHGDPGVEPPFDPNANFWHKWERPIHIEYYTPQGFQGLSQDAGIAIFGGFLGRQLRQKAFTIYARNKYGDSDFDFPLFPSKSINSYRRFILRCSSNDFNRTFIRDAMMQSLVIGQMDIDYQAYQPVIVYINGTYWGLYNMREKTNQFYAEHNYGIDADSVDLIEGIANTVHGDGETYHQLLDFISTHDMNIQSNYEYVGTQMDVIEFMNYYITEIFVCNHDWLYQNIKCWRNHSPGRKWRWLLYDLDWGFSGEFTWKTEDYTDNTFQWVHSQGEASKLFQSLMDNEEFRFEFIQRFATHLNLTFKTDRVLHIIDTMTERLSPEIPRQIERWEALRSMEYWNEQLDVLRAFAINRPAHLTDYLDVYYQMDGKSQFVFEVSHEEAGWISVFDTPILSSPYKGIWYEGIPMEIKAHANPGWKFTGWTGDLHDDDQTIKQGFFGDVVICAQFEPRELPSIMISEIHYNPSAELQGDDDDFEFLEIFNLEKERVDISGFKFTDGIGFTFPEGSYIDPGEFILLAKNPFVYDTSGRQYFRIETGRLNNAGEILTLRDSEDYIIDQVHFDDHYPWPRDPDGNGPSLELISPLLNNALASSWRASEGTGGSPGWGHYTHVEESISTSANELQVEVYPNPFHTDATIRYTLHKESIVSIKVFNLNGQEVEDLGSMKQLPGRHHIQWTPGDLSDGIYFIRLASDKDTQISKVLFISQM